MKKEKNKISFYRQSNIEIVHGSSSHSFPKHSHNSFCIGLVEQGKMLLELKGKEYLLEKNHVYFIPPFTEHKISQANNIKYGYTTICLFNDLSENYINGSLHKYISKDEKTRFAISNLISKLHHTNDYLQLEKDIKQFLEENLKVDYKLEPNAVVLSAVSYIKERLEETFNLKEISDYTHLSKYHLIRLFKAHIGVTPYQFYLQEKVKKVKQGLIKDETPVKLAYHLKFSDQSHLNNIFKKYIGLTPLEFKTSYKEENN